MAVLTTCERCGSEAYRIYVGPPSGVERWITLLQCHRCGLYRPDANAASHSAQMRNLLAALVANLDQSLAATDELLANEEYAAMADATHDVRAAVVKLRDAAEDRLIAADRPSS